MSTWYKISKYGKPEIKAVEVLKETPKFIVYLYVYWDGKTYERRAAKNTEFFPTFSEARQALINQLARRVNNALSEYSLAKKYWDEAFLMEPPPQ
jgi:hypothetical protein